MPSPVAPAVAFLNAFLDNLPLVATWWALIYTVVLAIGRWVAKKPMSQGEFILAILAAGTMMYGAGLVVMALCPGQIARAKDLDPILFLAAGCALIWVSVSSTIKATPSPEEPKPKRKTR